MAKTLKSLIHVYVLLSLSLFIATPVQAMEPLETTDILLQSQLKEMCQRNLADQEEIDKSHRLIENFRDRQNFSKSFSVFEADLTKMQKEHQHNTEGIQMLSQLNPESSADETSVSRGKTRRSVKKDTETILIEAGGVLIPKGTLVVDPSINHTHIDNNRISIRGYSIFNAILIGKFQVEEIKRDILTAALTFRYGITNRLQFDCKVPYVYRNERYVLPASLAGESESVIDADDYGLGDIEGGINYHAFIERGWIPDITFNLKVKTRTGRDTFGLKTKKVGGIEYPDELPTGSGFYGLSGGFSLVKVHDPVVFFFSLGYYWNIKRNVGYNIGEVDPGDSVEYSLGLATALSEKVSLSFGFQNVFTEDTQIEGRDIVDSRLNAANLIVGVNYQLSPRVSFLTSLGIGLTEDSSDYQVEIHVPITFKLF
jgi:hypothetical protein